MDVWMSLIQSLIKMVSRVKRDLLDKCNQTRTYQITTEVAEVNETGETGAELDKNAEQHLANDLHEIKGKKQNGEENHMKKAGWRGETCVT